MQIYMFLIKMPNLYEDVLYLIFKELQDDKKSLYSFLLVDKTWCKIIIPMLWKDPWKFLSMGKEKFLLDLIISRNDLDKGFSHKKPMFDYISFCKHLNLNEIERIIKMYDFMIFKKNEIINLFINGNAKFIYLNNLIIKYILFLDPNTAFQNLNFLVVILASMIMF